MISFPPPNASGLHEGPLTIHKEDELVNSFFMMGSHWPILILMSSYLYFVRSLGPSLMANRKPFKLKYVMIIYNIFQVVANAVFLSWFFTRENMISYLLQQSCYPTPRSNVPLRIFALRYSWVWLLLKMSDLLDTVFFVLRKKDKQISFLHLYHHTSIVLSVWMYIKYVRGEQGIMIGLVNCVVHIIMYGYYLLSALGPQVQKHLWWKKYITWMQLVQFWILTVFFSTLLLSCRIPPIQQAYNYYAVSQGAGFTWLFLRFYWKSYSQKKEAHITNAAK